MKTGIQFQELIQR